MSTIVKFGMVIGAAAMLAGCQTSPFAGWFSKSNSNRAETRTAPKIIGAQLIEEGRAQLAQGSISAAVATLRLARMDPATVAEAENGLGVAYAKIGRFDLADRYFRSAVEREPEDMRFTANLLRLQRFVMMARAARAAPVAVAKVEPAREMASAAPPVHRVSDGVMRITTREALGARPTMTVAFLERPTAAENLAHVTQTAEAPELAPPVAENEPSKQKLVVFPQ